MFIRNIFTLLSLLLILLSPFDGTAQKTGKSDSNEPLVIQLASIQKNSDFAQAVKMNEKVFFLGKDKSITLNDVRELKPNKDQSGNVGISVIFNAQGAKKFEKLTAANVGKYMAFSLKGKAVKFVQIKETVTGGRLLLTLGKYKQFEAVLNELVAKLKELQKTK